MSRTLPGVRMRHLLAGLLAVCITLAVLIFGGPIEQAIYSRLRHAGEVQHRSPGRRATDRPAT